MIEQNWQYLPSPSWAQIKALQAQSRKPLHPVIASLLIQRNIAEASHAREFFRPALSQLHDPWLMKDMDKAVARLQQAMVNDEKILVYGDYDVDGTTSVAVFYGFLSEYYPHLTYYIPDRYKEGYGISEAGIAYAEANGFSLIVSIDCGIKAIDKVATAKAQNIDFIICDHHNPGKQLPDAIAVLDPKRKDCSYPYKELSGCGVGFKLLQALCEAMEWSPESLFRRLDLLAVSIAADIVPITGENRVFAFLGLKLLNEQGNFGLNALLQSAGKKKPVNIRDVVFGIAPRINAAGRMDHAHGATKLLLSATEQEALSLVSGLESHNSNRRTTDEATTLEALAMIESSDKRKAARSTVLYKDDWHKGIIGIVASRCIETYYRPTIILANSGKDKITGSARSIADFDLYDALCECAEFIDQFGGHTHAAGLTISPDKLKDFEARFEEVVAARVSEAMLMPTIKIDREISFRDINRAFYKHICAMEPFGPAHMEPIFSTRFVQCANPARLLNEKHLKLELVDSNSGLIFDAIGFGMGFKAFELVDAGKPFHIAYTIGENTYKDKCKLQLVLKDIKAIEP